MAYAPFVIIGTIEAGILSQMSFKSSSLTEAFQRPSDGINGVSASQILNSSLIHIPGAAQKLVPKVFACSCVVAKGCGKTSPASHRNIV